MPALALALLALYGLLAVGLRIAIQLRRTGSTGVRLPGADPGGVERVAAVLAAAAIGLLIAGPTLELLTGLEPIGALDGAGAQIAGIVLAIGGIALTVAAQLAMGEAWRIGVDPGERTELVTGGPFLLVRNPIYSAMIPAFAGIALLAPNPFTIAGLVLVGAALEIQTRAVEEPHLSRVHGERYTAYAARVGRFVPGLGRLHGSRTEGSS